MCSVSLVLVRTLAADLDELKLSNDVREKTRQKSVAVVKSVGDKSIDNLF